MIEDLQMQKIPLLLQRIHVFEDSQRAHAGELQFKLRQIKRDAGSIDLLRRKLQVLRRYSTEGATRIERLKAFLIQLGRPDEISNPTGSSGGSAASPPQVESSSSHNH
jgi:hypothetical protein